MKAKPVVLWQKEKGFASSVTTYVAEDLASDRVEKKQQEDDTINLSAHSEGIQQRQTRPLGEVRSNHGEQNKLKLPELLPKLVEAVASKKPLKNNHVYSFEIEERSQDMTSGEVQVTRTNKWVFVNKDSYYLFDDQETNLPQIGGETAKVTHKDRGKEVEAKLRLANGRRQQKARKEILSKRAAQIPLPFETAMDRMEGVYRDRQILQQTRNSIRKILESRMIASSIPRKSKEFDVTSLKISNPTFVVSYGKGNSNSKGARPSSGSVAQYSASHPSFAASSQPKEATTSCCSLDNSQEIDDSIIESFYQQETSSAVSEESKDITARNDVNNDGTDESTTTVQSDNDGVFTIQTSRPTSSISILSLPDTEGLNSGPNSEPNEREDEKSICLKVRESERSRTSLSTYQSQGQDQIRARSARPTWPSLIDIQRLRSGGFRYRPSTAKSKEAREMTHNKKQQLEDGENDVTGVVEKKTSGLKRMGTIIVPSHTTVDCPLCNLYAREPTDPPDKSITVYQHPNQPKGAGFEKQNNLLTKNRTVSRKSVSSSNTKSRLTATVISKTTSKPIAIVKCRPSKTSAKKRPDSGNEGKGGRNRPKNNAQIPIAAIYDQEQPYKFSYVKAPSNLIDE